MSSHRAGQILSIDLGTSAVKVGVFDCAGELLSYARRPYPLLRGRGGTIEQEPDDWWTALRLALSEVLVADAGRHIGAICAGGQSPVPVLSDAAGRPTRRAISWLDDRSRPQRAKLAERLGEAVDAFSLVPQLAWIVENEPQVLDNTRWIFEPWDFLGYRLTGTAITSCCLEREVWSQAELKAADLAGLDILPPACAAGTAYGVTAGAWCDELGLPPGIPVVAGLNDGVATAVGAALTVPGLAADPGGSSGGLIFCADAPVIASGIICWPGFSRGSYLAGGPLAAGGKSVEWWATNTTNGDVDDLLCAARSAPAGCDGLLFLPFLAGERAPIWDSSTRAAFVGLTFDHDAARLARAVVESSGYSLRWLVDTVEETGVEIESIRLCGRQAQSQFWNQVKADITGHVVLIPRVTDAALMGGAIMGAVGAAAHHDLSSAAESMVSIAMTIEPESCRVDMYREHFRTYLAAYDAVSRISR